LNVSESQLLVVRHGRTDWSRSGRHTGRTDTALDEQGRAEAVAAGATLSDWEIDRAYSSPLVRARETAELAGFGEMAQIDDDLQEWDYGIFEGETTAETRTRIPDWSVWTHEILDGEAVEQVGERADRFLERFESETDAGNAIVFAHGHLLAILIARWCGLDAVEGRRFALATATVSVLGWHREDRVLRSLNHRCGDPLDPPARA
jgi:broad specificity phosphatase PhoE